MRYELKTPEIAALVGRTARYEAPDPIGHAAIRYFALALGEDNPLYLDDAYAQRLGHPSVIAPPTFVCETNQYMHQPPDDDGYIAHLWPISLPECRAFRGGNEYEFQQQVLPSDRINCEWTVSEIVERRSSTGEPMLIVYSDISYTNESDEPLARNRETFIYQRLSR